VANERCKCPGPNDVSPRGECPSCGYVGTLREAAIRSALASGRHQLAREIGRQEGRKAGLNQGIQIGRREAIEALAEREVERDPKAPEPDYELEAG
jgi:hypothetical protein